MATKFRAVAPWDDCGHSHRSEAAAKRCGVNLFGRATKVKVRPLANCGRCGKAFLKPLPEWTRISIRKIVEEKL
jgi:hypothetical protein